MLPPQDVAQWCERWLGSAPVAVLFRVAHLSEVLGLRLADGADVVVKARPPSERIGACMVVQQHLWRSGFACPEPLAGPAALGPDRTATAERYVPGGEQLRESDEAPRLFAEALAQLVASARPLVHTSLPDELHAVQRQQPDELEAHQGQLPDQVHTLETQLPDAFGALRAQPPWVGWQHDQHGTWPVPDDLEVDLNAHVGPDWIEDAARRVRSRLLRPSRLAVVIGHADWESQNLRWVGRQLHAVHDWDSVVAQPEATIAGAAAAVFTATGAPDTSATVTQTQLFLTAYAAVRGRAWSDEERQLAWAAGLWVRLFNAKKATLRPGGTSLSMPRLRAELAERLRHAGA